jgi:hypothetical protein
MRRSTIAVCLLLGLPSPACACMDDHKNGEWLDEKTPSTSWQIARTIAEGYPGEESLQVCAIAVGSASTALTAIWLPAVLRARRRRRVKLVELDVPAPLVLPFDWLPARPIRVDQCDNRPGEILIIRDYLVR